jgi:hypothetical protein
MSTYPSASMRAGLVTVERNGRVMTYRADLDGLRGLLPF